MAETKTSAPAANAGALRGAVGTPLGNTLAIAKREFRAYFGTPMGYIIIAIFTLLLSVLFFFLFGFLVLRRATMQPLFTSISWLLPLLCAAISMRSFAEERRLGTLELLITMPVRDGEVIMGKFLGAMGLLATTLAATLVFPIAVSRMGDLDMGPVWGGYLGLLLGGGAYIAIGLLVSSYAADQVSAFFITFFIGMLLFIFDKGLIFMGVNVAQYLEYFSFDYHFKSIARGVIDSRNVIFFVSVITACLLATARSLNGRRWS
jgi:ABC-2 type transport system permease protein